MAEIGTPLLFLAAWSLIVIAIDRFVGWQVERGRRGG